MNEWLENENIKIMREFGFEESDECTKLLKMILIDFADEVETNWDSREYWPEDVAEFIINYTKEDTDE